MTVLDAAAAGAAGGTALNVVTYLDMAIRGRPASQTAEETVRRLADRSHVDLGPDEQAANRRSGLGPLLGNVAAIGTAVIFGAAARNRRIPIPAAAPLLGAGAMVAANAPLTALRVTDPRTWSRTDWVADIVPHIVYGVVTAAVWHRLASAHRRGRTRFRRT
ncbi:MAG TPA: hypothetical protein VHN18_04135 [Micromonosporaceae bacterium]|nr:hypothetical protein [Micromonosporaceae bacterium]